MSNSLGCSRVSDTGLALRYRPCAKDEHTDDDELEEISICDDRQDGDVSNLSKTEDDNTENDDDQDMHADVVGISTQKNDVEINGPQLLPGSPLSITSSPSNDKTKLIAEHIGSKAPLPSTRFSNKIPEENKCRSRTTSRQSIFELVRIRTIRKPSRDDSCTLIKKGCANEAFASKGIRKQRRKEIETRFGKKSIRSDSRTNIDNNVTFAENDGCKWTFVFDPSGRLSYWWSSVVSIAFIYNFWVIIYRFAFQEINRDNISVWFTMDYFADILYTLDIAFHFRTGYLEDGVLQTDSTKLRIHYMNTTNFYIDCLCLLPLDFLYLSIGFCSILRCFRLVKVYRFWMFLDRTERHTNYPNVIRTTTLMHYLLALFHWNACLYYIVANRVEKHSGIWEFPKDNDDVMRQYLHALYLSTLTLTTVGKLQMPRTIADYLFTIFEMLFGLLLFATVLGHISNIVSCISTARKDFQAKLDNVKTYMSLRRVPPRLQDRVIKWFDYLWMCNKSTDEEKTLGLLPDKLKAEIAIHVHLDTLKRVEIFQQTEAGFLCELVLRLNPVLFSPGDYICRKGEVGKEMYIVNRGRLHVVGDNGKTVLATLKPGSYFGEISILNMGTSGNRRTASVRSVGYSDLFRLSKQDLWDVLKEYPAARVKLEAIAVMRLKKTEKKPIDTVDLKRSKSTPGLVESSGKVLMHESQVMRHHTLPAGLPSHSSSADNHDSVSHDGVITMQSVSPKAGDPAPCVTSTIESVQETSIKAVSTLTTFINNNDVPVPMFRFNPPMSSAPTMYPSSSQEPTQNMVSICEPVAGPFSDCAPRDLPYDLSARVPAQYQLLHYPYPPYIQNLPSAGFDTSMTPHPLTFLTPFCTSGYMPSISSNPLISRNNSSVLSNVSNSSSATSRTFGQHIIEGQSAATTVVDNETSHESLVQEINRLRERLRAVESENALMSSKLNQQQWELEHRLDELEMHITCASEMASTGSTDDRSNPFENVSRESII